MGRAVRVSTKGIPSFAFSVSHYALPHLYSHLSKHKVCGKNSDCPARRPFSLVGAFWFLYILGYNTSPAVWVGLIALAGLDAETGVVMLLYLDQAWEKSALPVA